MGRTRHGPRGRLRGGKRAEAGPDGLLLELAGGGAGQGGAVLERSWDGRLYADRPAGAREFEELVTMDRSAKIFLPVRTVTWALDGRKIRAESYYN